MKRFRAYPLNFEFFIISKWNELNLNHKLPTEKGVVMVRSLLREIENSNFENKDSINETEIINLMKLCDILGIQNLFFNWRFEEIKKIIETINEFFINMGWARVLLPDNLDIDTIIFIEVNKQIFVNKNFISYCKKEWAYSEESLIYKIVQKYNKDFKKIYQSLKKRTKSNKSINTIKKNILTLTLEKFK